MRRPSWVVFPFLVLASSCVHGLEIVNAPPALATAPIVQSSVVVGVVSNGAPETEGYVEAVAKALQRHGAVRRVVHPWSSGAEVDYVAKVTVDPEYRGSGTNFLVNFPGFLIFAPAWYGYVYHANPRTRIELERADGTPIDVLAFEHDYEFRQADIGRTWTEVSWFEWGVIALVGGVVFTRYDTDQTPAFIASVADGYGRQVATLIGNRLATAR